MIINSNNKIINTNWSAGNGLKLDAVNDYINLGNILNFTLATPFSISIIAYTTVSFTTRGQIIYSKFYNDRGYYITLNKDRSGLILRTVVGAANYTYKVVISNFSTEDYKYFTCTYDGLNTLDSINIYEKGELNETSVEKNNGATNITTADNLILGNLTPIGSFKFAGIIYDIKVFDKELTKAEVTKLYQTQGQLIPASAIANLVADWRFDQKAGTVLKDYSGNVYNGTLTNFETTSNLGGGAWVDKYGNPITQY
jgi:hypothetical protein